MAALDVTLKAFVAGVELAGAGETFTIDVMTILEKEDITVVAPAGTLFFPLCSMSLARDCAQVVSHLAHANADQLVTPGISGGKRGFIKKVILAYQKGVSKTDGPTPNEDCSSSGNSSDVQAALLCLLGKPAKELVHVDMTAKMNSLGLTKYFPSDAWPPHNAVRETATKIRSRVKQGEEKPFVFVDLRK